MKTPQEIEFAIQCGDPSCRGFGAAEIQSYGDARASAAREEGRRETFRSVEVYLEGSANIQEEIGLRIETEGLLGDSKLCHSRARVLRQKAAHVRALASQSKPEPEKGKAP